MDNPLIDRLTDFGDEDFFVAPDNGVASAAEVFGAGRRRTVDVLMK